MAVVTMGKTELVQERSEWLENGNVRILIRVGRSSHPDMEGQLTWMVSMWDEEAGTKMAMRSGWEASLLDASIAAARAAENFRTRLLAGEWEGDPDEPF